jgi:hypothetical protein
MAKMMRMVVVMSCPPTPCSPTARVVPGGLSKRDNILRTVILYNFSKLQVASNDSHLVWCLVRIVQGITFAPPEQKQTCTALLAVYSTDV